MAEEEARPMTIEQYREIVCMVIPEIPKDLTFREANNVIRCGRHKFADDIAAAFTPFRTKDEKKVVAEKVEETTPQIADQSPYKITVPYRGKDTIKNLFQAGEYNWSNDDITDEHFPQEREGDEEIEIHLVHLDRFLSTKEVLKELDRRGLRPANAAELLALGATHPDLQRQFPIVALGQVWRYSHGSRGVVFLSRRDYGRDANLDWTAHGWYDHYRFACVHK